MSHLMIYASVAVFLVSVIMPNAESADQQYRERVLVGDFPGSGGKNDRQLIAAMVGQKLQAMSAEIHVEHSRWPHLQRLRAQVEENLPGSMLALKLKWSKDKDVLALMSGANMGEEFSSTIVLGEKVSGFQVESGAVDFPRKTTFHKARDATALLLYYALLKDARQKDLPQDEIIKPMLTMAREILADVKKTVDEPWVKDIADDLEKLHNTR
jgi:hypothetical protein